LVQTDCGTNATCKGKPARCVERFCTPGETTCDGERSMVCNASGDGLELVEDCAAANQSCIGAGVCTPRICHEGDLVCTNGNVERCGMKGTAYGLFQRCEPATQVCDDSTGSAQCVFACTPNAPLCDGNVLTTCSLDGKALNAGGVDCTASNEVCDPSLTACAPKVCEPHSTYCKNGDVYACIDSGARETLFQTCKGAEFCRDYPIQSAYCEPDVCVAGQTACVGSFVSPCNTDGSGFDASLGADCGLQNATCIEFRCFDCGSSSHVENNTCVLDICSKGAAACVENRITTCNAAGTAFDPGGTDCTSLGQICDANRQCATSAVDTVGTWNDSAYTQYGLYANVYRVDSARHLTQIEMNIRVMGADSLAWIVYESSDHQHFSKILEVTTPITGDGSLMLASSGAISLDLVPGNEYAIGMYSPVDAHLGRLESPSTGLELTSFGQVLGGEFSYTNVSTFGGYGSSVRNFQRLTTVP
jgi:hypothetical protein